MKKIYENGIGGFADFEDFTIEGENHRRYILLYFHTEYYTSHGGNKKMDEDELTEKIPKPGQKVSREFVFSQIKRICAGTHFESYCPQNPKDIDMSAFY